jgi:hypothetical protein
MLRELCKFIGSRECFCLPHAWLEGFYGIIGFAKIEDGEIPLHLLKRLGEYSRKHSQLIIMRRAANT